MPHASIESAVDVSRDDVHEDVSGAAVDVSHTPGQPARAAVDSAGIRATAEPVRMERAVRAAPRRDDVGGARGSARRVRKEASTKAQHPSSPSDVMPNPYHD